MYQLLHFFNFSFNEQRQLVLLENSISNERQSEKQKSIVNGKFTKRTDE